MQLREMKDDAKESLIYDQRQTKINIMEFAPKPKLNDARKNKSKRKSRRLRAKNMDTWQDTSDM